MAVTYLSLTSLNPAHTGSSGLPALCVAASLPLDGGSRRADDPLLLEAQRLFLGRAPHAVALFIQPGLLKDLASHGRLQPIRKLWQPSNNDDVTGGRQEHVETGEIQFLSCVYCYWGFRLPGFLYCITGLY